MVGLRCTSGWKSHSVMPWQTSSPSAVTVAERAPPVDQRDLAEVVAGAERAPERTADGHRRRARLDEVERRARRSPP